MYARKVMKRKVGLKKPDVNCAYSKVVIRAPSIMPSTSDPPPTGIETRLYIDGKFVEAKSGKSFPLYNPTTEKKTAEVAEAGEEDADLAVEAASRAFRAWRDKSPFEREAYFLKLAALMERDRDEIAYLEAITMGIPIHEYGAYIDGAVSGVKYAAGLVHGVHGESSLNTPGYLNITLRQPYGVCAAITPWNVPVIMFCGKMVPCVVAGNCIVIKSSEKAPLTSIKLAALCHEAGFPPGVINVLTGFGHTVGAALARHMDVRKISFTGSTRAGKSIVVAAAESNMKRVTVEMGGKNPAVVFNDADLAKAVRGCANSILINSGQICVSNSRIYVEDGIFDAFVHQFKQQFTAIKMGDPTDPTTRLGPQVDKVQFESVLNFIESAKQQGATAIVGGARATAQGYFIQPTIFIDVPPSCSILTEEVFGPVVVIQRFISEEAVLQLCNDTIYGLHASVFTADFSRAHRVAQAFEAGMVNINCASPIGPYDLPFGGYKSSGMGRENGHTGIEEYYETKTLTMEL
jgi:aldehyde dehydrogenase (NAD+)